jgi:hypothetical protein
VTPQATDYGGRRQPALLASTASIPKSFAPKSVGLVVALLRSGEKGGKHVSRKGQEETKMSHFLVPIIGDQIDKSKSPALVIRLNST